MGRQSIVEHIASGKVLQMSTARPNEASLHEVGQELVALLARLGLDAVIRDPESVEIVASTPGAEAVLLAAPPGKVRVATARIANVSVRVELNPPKSMNVDLTPRQEAVGALLKKGLRNKEIGEKLGISTHTVRRHLEQLFRRLDVNDRTEAVEALERVKRRS
jgi:DNA-binding CsgD family transcriptional regulator